MKKIVFLLLISLLLITGCGNTERKKELEVAARDYYLKYLKGIEPDGDVTISLDVLRTANNANGDLYEISSLKDCDSETAIIFEIVGGEIKNKSFALKC